MEFAERAQCRMFGASGDDCRERIPRSRKTFVATDAIATRLNDENLKESCFRQFRGSGS